MPLTAKQQARINNSCLNFRQKMQKLVNEKGSGIDGISMTIGGKTVIIAEKTKGEST